jgi:formylmethanofuran dehydrogenase subunit A
MNSTQNTPAETIKRILNVTENLGLFFNPAKHIHLNLQRVLGAYRNTTREHTRTTLK